MTHPDDEISICAWIRRLTENGNQVFMSWSHSTPRREQEGRAVAELLGVPQTHLKFFAAADALVVKELGRLKDEYREWLDFAKPDRIACGAFEQGHIDHDATNVVVNSVFEGPVFEIPFYHAYLSRIQRINRFAHPEGEEVLHLTEGEQRLKKHIARQYPSQNIWQVLTWYEAYTAVQFRPAGLAKTERMRLQTHRDFLRPNLPPKLRARVERSEPWRIWRESAAAHLNDFADEASIPVRS